MGHCQCPRGGIVNKTGSTSPRFSFVVSQLKVFRFCFRVCPQFLLDFLWVPVWDALLSFFFFIFLLFPPFADVPFPPNTGPRGPSSFSLKAATPLVYPSPANFGQNFTTVPFCTSFTGRKGGFFFFFLSCYQPEPPPTYSPWTLSFSREGFFLVYCRVLCCKNPETPKFLALVVRDVGLFFTWFGAVFSIFLGWLHNFPSFFVHPWAPPPRAGCFSIAFFSLPLPGFAGPN